MRRNKTRIGNDDIKIGAALRSMRSEMGLSQTAMGEKAGVTFQQWQKYEKGKNRIALSTLLRVLDAVEIKVQDFCDGI